MEAQSLSTCNQCGKKFQRRAHLLRHQQQHSGDRPYSCKFCSKTFKRSDVLRDHFSRCELRGSSAIPSSLERGRKRHACDECSRLKVKCDSNVPCRKCKEFGRVCVKSRPLAAPSPEATTPNTSASDMTPSTRNSIGFLLNGPGEKDFMREFPKSTTMSPNSSSNDTVPTLNGVDPLVGHFTGKIVPGSQHSSGPVNVEQNLDAFLSNLEFETFKRRTHNLQNPGESMFLWSGQDIPMLDQAILEQRAFDIREKLRYAAAAENPPNVPAKEVLDAIEIITASNIVLFIKLYFEHWHKHGPMVHEASFNPCTTAVPLVLALMAVGGMYCKDPEITKKLKLLLDTIEGFIYSIPGLKDEYDLPDRVYIRRNEDSSPEWQQYQLEELQGAYLMIVLQYWTGNAIARARVRQQRFSRVVAIFHDLEMQTVQHAPTFVINDQESFRSWIRTESSIRTATLALMLDNAFGMFNNLSPKFQWAEIDLTFPGDEQCFMSANYEELVAKSIYPRPKMKMKEAFLILFSTVESEEDNLKDLRSGNLTALDMQMLIHILYTTFWSNTFCNPMVSLQATNVQQLLLPFKLAMSNWKMVWDEIKASAMESEWNKLGFQRTAESYYNAIMALLQVFEKREGKFPPIPTDCEKGSHLKRLLSF